jgi:hypothetical protein
MGAVVVLLLCGLAFLLGCFPMHDHDTWWHMAAARLIVESGRVPTVDVLTYTADKPWIDLYWLPQLLFLGLYKLGGASALVLMKAIAGVAVIALGLTSRRRGGRAGVAMLAWLPALILISGRLCERPELVSFVALAAFLAVLGHANDRPWLLWLLPFVQILWVNSHGLFVLGPAILATYAVGLVVDRKPSGKAWAVAGATLAACIVNPYGWHVVDHAWAQAHQLDAGFYRAHIAELQSPLEFVRRFGVNNPYLLALFVLTGIGISSFAIQAHRTRPSTFRALLFLGAAYLGFQATRLAPIFAIVTAVVSVWNLDDALGEPKRGQGLAPIATVVAMALWVLSGSFYAWAGEGRTIGVGEKPHTFAHDACAFLARPGMPQRAIAANLGQSAVCAYHLQPDQRQFVISRIEPSASDVFPRYIDGLSRLAFDRPGWESSLGIDYDKPAEVPAILIERGPLDRASAALERNPHWRRAYLDDVAAVFLPSAVVPQ